MNKTHDAVCVSPKLTGIFGSTFPDHLKTSFDYKLDEYCKREESLVDIFSEAVLTQTNYYAVGNIVSK
jgi:hypothetical protein